MTLRFRATAGVLAASLLLLSACSGSDDSPAAKGGDTTDLTFVIASAVIGPKEEVAMYAVAEELGYFEEEGLSVDTVNSDGSVAAVQAVGTGQGEITASDTGSILAAVEKNVPIMTVGGLVQNWPWQIATLPDSDITGPEDLDGKKIGVISLASGSAPYARAFVKAGGLDPEADVELLPVGVGAQAASALTSGQVDVLALYTQAYSVIELSGTELAYLDNPPLFEGIRSLSFAVNASELSSDPGTYEGFLRAAYKAMLFSAQNPEAAMKIGYRVFPDILAGQSEEDRLADDVANLEAWLATATPTSGSPADWSDWGAIPDEDWTKTQEYTVEAGQISGEVDLAKAWDDSLLAAANDFDAAAVIDQADNWEE